jgi:hypothetical protein
MLYGLLLPSNSKKQYQEQSYGSTWHYIIDSTTGMLGGAFLISLLPLYEILKTDIIIALIMGGRQSNLSR